MLNLNLLQKILGVVAILTILGSIGYFLLFGLPPDDNFYSVIKKAGIGLVSGIFLWFCFILSVAFKKS